MFRLGIKSLSYILIIVSIFSFIKCVSRNASHRIKNIVNNYGYPFEIHSVETEDGYLLEMHRIPHGSWNKKFEGKRPVVFLKHGLTDSSASFVTTGPNQSLAYQLADNGYDVWLGNHRGNTFCKKHKIYTEDNTHFWNFSWHEIGLYDNPAMVDYILKTTNQEKIFHVCHSEGCTEFYVMTSLKPEYNNKFSLSINLAPAVLFEYPTIRTSIALAILYSLKETSSEMGYIEVLSEKSFFWRTITSLFCNSRTILRPVCYIMTCILHGFDWFQTDMSLLPKLWEFYPSGSSIKQMIHFAALQYYPGTFRQYDYGRGKNLELYNSTIPPKYSLEKVSVPVVVFYGDRDNLVSLQDTKKLIKLIPNCIESHLLKYYNHVGYMLQASAKRLVYDKVVQLFGNFETNNSVL